MSFPSLHWTIFTQIYFSKLATHNVKKFLEFWILWIWMNEKWICSQGGLKNWGKILYGTEASGSANFDSSIRFVKFLFPLSEILAVSVNLEGRDMGAWGWGCFIERVRRREAPKRRDSCSERARKWCRVTILKKKKKKLKKKSLKIVVDVDHVEQYCSVGATLVGCKGGDLLRVISKPPGVNVVDAQQKEGNCLFSTPRLSEFQTPVKRTSFATTTSENFQLKVLTLKDINRASR